jgi:DNA-directed RNA polymerase subunit L
LTEKGRREPVGFVGRFEMTVPDILQILSLSKKTGKLRLSRLGNTGEVLFRSGKVTFASSDSARHTLSNTLISQKRLTESALMAALELQHLSSDNKRLGAILVEKGIITREVLQEALRSQIEQVMAEFLNWENGFFRFDMTEIAADDGIAIDVSEFLTRSGIQPELLFHEGASPVDGRRDVETACPEPVEGPRPEPLDSARGRPTDSARGRHVEGRQPRPERYDLDSRPETTVSGLAEQFGPELVQGPLADLIEGQWESERPPWIKPEVSPSPALEPEPPIRIEERYQVETPSPEPLDAARDRPLDSARGKHVEGRPEKPRPAPEAPLRPAPAMPRPERVEGPAAEAPTPSIPAGRKPPVPASPVASQTPPTVSTGEAPKPMSSTAKGQQAPTSAAPSGPSLEDPFQEIEPSRITDEIMLNSPIAPWVLIMHLAADVVSRGVLLFVRKDGITGHDQFGVGGARDSGDERVINMKIPWNEPSILAAATHARTTYRGKISPGKWNDYFLNQLGGKRPDEAVIIPIIVAGKVVAIFYGDDAGSGTPLGDVERLQALIDQTFSAVEASILAKRRKPSA